MAYGNSNKGYDSSKYHLLKIVIIVAIIVLLIGLFFSGKLSLPDLQNTNTEQGK